jgi:EAL domain-containing protein (putative c-di-GMP-specific phosphodiesterase class I)
MLMVLSRSLGLGVVAEGIETRGQWEKLRELGCRFGQGYFFARPLDATTLTKILESDVALALREPLALAS